MGEAKFSPGPWCTGEFKDGFIEILHYDLRPGAISSPLAKVINRKTWSLQAEANADLIAAAPCMYEALAQLLDDMGDTGLSVCQAAKDQAIAALAKALGESS